ncbi:DUF4911 domain-containing protein [Desulfovibrio legallii]|uniref:DUF4911 domain-containing protein n=1 Tax=Desulfovibrio legallii TaxID=571438 RepID=A0A1G7KYK5_9BACT|nr:DUF4911 domain-containing protein [Desulfovibrio legallii]SDF42337.1 protein of unknown function [Desulfovibrio legallii]
MTCRPLPLAAPEPATGAEAPPKPTPPALQAQRRPRPAAPAAPRRSACLLLRMAPEHAGLFRRLLEAYDNLAYFTALETDTALFKLVFSPHMAAETHAALAAIARSVPFAAQPWPLANGGPAPAAGPEPPAKRL